MTKPVLPDYRGACISNIVPTLLEGTDEPTPWMPSPALEADQVVLLVLDGLGWDQRVPYATPIEGLYAASAGCHPAGSVIGCAGHNAARHVLSDLGLAGGWGDA